MRYNLEDIETQIEITLKADPALSGVLVKPHAGEINIGTFVDPARQEGFIHQMPFIMYQYQGKRNVGKDATKQRNVHELTFRFYVGAQSMRATNEAKISAYSLLRSVYDNIHGHFIVTAQSLAPNVLRLSGEPIDTVALSPFMEIEGKDEQLIVNLQGIIVYNQDYCVRVLA